MSLPTFVDKGNLRIYCNKKEARILAKEQKTLQLSVSAKQRDWCRSVTASITLVARELGISETSINGAKRFLAADITPN